jgi:hypothetical protein
MDIYMVYLTTINSVSRLENEPSGPKRNCLCCVSSLGGHTQRFNNFINIALTRCWGFSVGSTELIEYPTQARVTEDEVVLLLLNFRDLLF